MLLKAFLRSFLLMTIIAVFMGLGTLALFHSFIGGFILAYVIQVLGGYVWNTYLERKEHNFAQTISNEIDSQIGKLTTPLELSCAYCNIVNKIQFALGDTTHFKCVSCNQPNKIYVQFTTVRITSPITTNLETGEVDMDQEPKEDNMRQTTINEPISVTSEAPPAKV